MKAEDFRVGIYVVYENEEKCITEDDMEIIMSSRNYKDYRPIYLFEENLLSFGFKRSGVLNDTYFYNNDIMFKMDNIHREDRYDVQLKIGNETFWVVGRCMRFIHQLQSFYYCITGNNLILNKAADND